jgi:hypothetical protein
MSRVRSQIYVQDECYWGLFQACSTFHGGHLSRGDFTFSSHAWMGCVLSCSAQGDYDSDDYVQRRLFARLCARLFTSSLCEFSLRVLFASLFASLFARSLCEKGCGVELNLHHYSGQTNVSLLGAMWATQLTATLHQLVTEFFKGSDN